MARTDLFSLQNHRPVMGIVIPLASVSGFWLLIAVAGPLLVPSGPNRGIVRTMIIMTAVCCWSFWIMVYLHQLNPLIGPQISVRTIRWIAEVWGTAKWNSTASGL